MKRHFPYIPEENIFFVSHMSDHPLSKADICREHGATLLFDDNMRNARECLDAGIATILFERPWNRDDPFEHPLLYRVTGWEAIIPA